MIKTTIKKIQQSAGAVSELMGIKLPVKASYAVGKLAEACDAEMKRFDAKRKKLFEDAGCKVNEKSGNYEPPAVGDDADEEKKKAAQAAFDKVLKDIDDLTELEVEINALMLNLDHFGSAEIRPMVFAALDWAVQQ